MKATLALLLLAASCAPLTAPPQTFVDRRSPSSVRVMTWNVGANSIFEGGETTASSPDRPEAFARTMRALKPDVVCLEEVSRGFQATGALLDRVLPLDDGAQWKTYGLFDVVVASRWPLTGTESRLVEDVSRKRAHVMANVDLPGARDLYVVCMHNQSRSGPENVAFRQLQSDMIASWLRDARTPGGAIDLPSRTPLVIAGDMNVISSDAGNHVRTLLTGDVSDDASYGPDAPPDWDGTELIDVKPLQNGRGPEDYTWRADAEGFPPSALDRVIYTDSVLRVENAFVLNTKAMTDAELAATGMRPGDSLRDPATDFYDHLPVVVDFTFADDQR